MTNKFPKISVIVPVYNDEQYLPRCIDSILAQTFADFELLLIDDGSKDHSSEICDEYAEKDRRIRVFHKENGGVSSARNLGLDNAIGEWIAFVDSDDKIEKGYLYNLCINSNDVDFVICGYKQDGRICKTVVYKEGIFNMHSYDDLSYFNRSEIESKCLFYCPWRKLFKNKLIKENHIKFDESMFLGEDTCFLISYVKYVNKLKVINDTSYIYSLPSVFGKYMMNFRDFCNHIRLFDTYLSSLDEYKNYQYDKIRAMMYGAYLDKYMTYLLTLKVYRFRSGVIKYKKTDFSLKIKKCLFKYYSMRKKITYNFVLIFPLIGYYLKKYKQKYRRI